MASKELDMTITQNEIEQESEDECEVYFLKPVNEYNIVDKINEANKELFSDDNSLDDELTAELQQNRKVSFAANLEEYEPQNGINLAQLEDKLGRYCIVIEEDKFKIEMDHKLKIITEEETVNEIVTNETCETNPQKILTEEEKEEQTLTSAMEDNEDDEVSYKRQEKHIVSTTKCSSYEENIILEEICEEILIMDMESDEVETANVIKFDSRNGMQRKILKQITFDYTEDDDEEVRKSLTNLLISDNENDDSNDDENEIQEYSCTESFSDDTDTGDNELLTNAEYYENDAEDDKLSIIVASYLSDDMVCDKTSLTPSPCNLKHRNSPVKKRFSFRRKTKSSNAIGSYSNNYGCNNRHFVPPPEVTDLKLHYKSCCELKNAQEKLPNYTGYISEYGLSKEQLIKRERKLQQKQHHKVMSSLKASESETRKMHDNERAFTTWLKNKMRFPINKTRNMFDVKRPFGIRKCVSLGGNTLNDDTNNILNTNVRSVSAKFRKA